jgi:hypothetical protein
MSTQQKDTTAELRGRIMERMRADHVRIRDDNAENFRRLGALGSHPPVRVKPPTAAQLRVSEPERVAALERLEGAGLIRRAPVGATLFYVIEQHTGPEVRGTGEVVK